MQRSHKNGAYSSTISVNRSTKKIATRTRLKYAYTTKGIVPMYRLVLRTSRASASIAYLCVAYACELSGLSTLGDMGSFLTAPALAIPESASLLGTSLAMLAWLFGDGVQSLMKERPRLTRSA